MYFLSLNIAFIITYVSLSYVHWAKPVSEHLRHLQTKAQTPHHKLYNCGNCDKLQNRYTITPFILMDFPEHIDTISMG